MKGGEGGGRESLLLKSSSFVSLCCSSPGARCSHIWRGGGGGGGGKKRKGVCLVLVKKNLLCLLALVVLITVILVSVCSKGRGGGGRKILVCRVWLVVIRFTFHMFPDLVLFGLDCLWHVIASWSFICPCMSVAIGGGGKGGGGCCSGQKSGIWHLLCLVFAWLSLFCCGPFGREEGSTCRGEGGCAAWSCLCQPLVLFFALVHIFLLCGGVLRRKKKRGGKRVLGAGLPVYCLNFLSHFFPPDDLEGRGKGKKRGAEGEEVTMPSIWPWMLCDGYLYTKEDFGWEKGGGGRKEGAHWKGGKHCVLCCTTSISAFSIWTVRKGGEKKGKRGGSKKKREKGGGISVLVHLLQD